MQIGEYIKVYDSINGKELLAGKIIKSTLNPEGHSIDGKLFFNPNSNKFKIEVLNYELQQFHSIYCMDQKYIRYTHNNIDNTFDYDFFEWNDIELEVVEICKLLNQIPGIETYSSCSGHGKIPPYVDFHVQNWDSFCAMLDFLHKNNQPSKTVKHNDIKSRHRFVIGVEGKGTIHLESLEINYYFEELCRVLKKYIKKVDLL